MKHLLQSIILISCLFTACSSEANERAIEGWKTEIAEAEKGFASMVKEQGIPAAFLAYADEEAVLMRSNSLVIGRDAIRQRFENNPTGDRTLSWSPDFIDVSASGDLGYTYGGYTYSSIDSAGQTVKSEGVFHTVWKRQTNGSWKFVWD